MRVWLDGETLDADEARIDPADRGFLLGDGAFETMRFANGRVRRWTAHASRLAAALDTLGIAAPDWRALREACQALAAENALTDAVVRLTVSRGAHGRGFDAPQVRPGTVLITASERPEPPASVRLASVDAPRREPTSLATRFKPIGYGDALHARRLARAQGADMALMRAGDGRPSCADCANIVWIAGRRFNAPGPEAGALAGTTRAALLGPIREQSLLQDGDLALEHAEAAFVCNAVMGVVAVSQIDARALAADHEILARLKRAEEEAV